MRARAPHRIGNGSRPVSATRPAKIEMQLAESVAQGRNDGVHLIERHQRGDVDFHALLGKALHQRRRAAAMRVGDRDFDVDVLAPSGDAQRLLFHLVKIVRENFEGKWPLRNGLARAILPNDFVIGDPGLAHQCGIGGEAPDPRIVRQFQNRSAVGAVGENLDAHRSYVRHNAPFPTGAAR